MQPGVFVDGGYFRTRDAGRGGFQGRAIAGEAVLVGREAIEEEYRQQAWDLCGGQATALDGKVFLRLCFCAKERVGALRESSAPDGLSRGVVAVPAGERC